MLLRGLDRNAIGADESKYLPVGSERGTSFEHFRRIWGLDDPLTVHLVALPTGVTTVPT